MSSSGALRNGILLGRYSDRSSELLQLFHISDGHRNPAPVLGRRNQGGVEQRQTRTFGRKSWDDLRAPTKYWLPRGAIDPQDHRLAIELASPGFHLNKRNKLVIESKSMTARGLASPDRADALCLTFAMPVSSKPKLRLVSSRDAVMPTGTSSWMGP